MNVELNLYLSLVAVSGWYGEAPAWEMKAKITRSQLGSRSGRGDAFAAQERECEWSRPTWRTCMIMVAFETARAED